MEGPGGEIKSLGGPLGEVNILPDREVFTLKEEGVRGEK